MTQPKGVPLPAEPRSITRTLFSEVKDDGGGHAASLVERDLQYLESLGDMASDFLVGLALRGCTSIFFCLLSELRLKGSWSVRLLGHLRKWCVTW